MTVVRITHPDVALLEPAAQLFDDVVAGSWGTIATLCADRLVDVDAARRNLDALTAGLRLGEPVDHRLVVGEDVAIWQGEVGTVVAALDLFQRVLIGQWDQAQWVASLHAPEFLERKYGDALLSMRTTYSKPTEQGGFPPWPNASFGIAEGPQSAKLAYHAWKQLGGGTSGSPTFSVGQAVAVDVLTDGAAGVGPERS